MTQSNLQFKLYINADNEAFERWPQYQMAVILSTVSKTIKHSDNFEAGMSEIILDLNGNKVGSWMIVDYHKE
jgi:hypothetical protein